MKKISKLKKKGRKITTVIQRAMSAKMKPGKSKKKRKSKTKKRR